MNELAHEEGLRADPMLEVRNLSVDYRGKWGVKGVFLQVGRGEVVAVLGANGAGKSTLATAIAGLSRGRVKGSVLLDGCEISRVPAYQRSQSGVVIVPEGRSVFRDLTVAENLRLGVMAGAARGASLEDIPAIIDGEYKWMRDRGQQDAGTLSGGQQQMLVLARSALARPRLLILDEPSLGLSPIAREQLFEHVMRFSQRGVGVLLVEQNVVSALDIAARGYVLARGDLVRTGTAKELRADPAVKQAYMGGDVEPAAAG